MIDPAGPPGECRVTTGSVCPNCSLVSDEGAVVSRVPDVELVEAEPWPPADLGGGDA